MKNEEEFIRGITNSDEIQKVELDDTIEVGCNDCGSCCMNTQVRLNSYDLYQMSKVFDKQSIVDNVTLYYGDESHLPVISLSSTESGLCPYLKSNLEGDFKCVLGDNKPSTCHHPFAAIATKLDKSDLDFVPLDEEVPEFDIDAYLEQVKIENSEVYYLKDRNEHCRSNCKSQITVREYLSPRLGDQNERNLATVIPMLYNRYFDVYVMNKILHLAENSKVHGPLEDLFNKDSTLSKVSKTMFAEAYFYTKDPNEDNTPFVEQSIKHIRHLEKSILPKYRILYKYLLIVFRTPDEDEFDAIIKESNMDKAQKMFDKYFIEHMDDIKRIVVLDMMPNMSRELKELMSKLED